MPRHVYGVFFFSMLFCFPPISWFYTVWHFSKLSILFHVVSIKISTIFFMYANLLFYGKQEKDENQIDNDCLRLNKHNWICMCIERTYFVQKLLMNFLFVMTMLSLFRPHSELVSTGLFYSMFIVNFDAIFFPIL